LMVDRSYKLHKSQWELGIERGKFCSIVKKLLGYVIGLGLSLFKYFI